MGNDFYNSCKRCNGSGTEHTWSPTANDRPAGGGGIIVCRACNGSGIDYFSPKKRQEYQPSEPSSDTPLSDEGSGISGFLFACVVIFFAVFGLSMWLADFFYGSTESKDLPHWFMLTGLLTPFVVMILGRREIGLTAIICVMITAAAYYFG